MPQLSSSDDDEEKVKRSRWRRGPPSRRPTLSDSDEPTTRAPRSQLAQLALVVLAIFVWQLSDRYYIAPAEESLRQLGSSDPTSLRQWHDTVDRCLDLDLVPGVPDHFYNRNESDRFVAVRSPLTHSRAPPPPRSTARSSLELHP